MTDSGLSGGRALGRALAVGLALLVGWSAVVAGVATVAVGASAETADAADASNPIEFAYVDAGTGNVTFVREDGTRVGTNVTADVLGPMADLDGDGLLEAPYVTSQGEVRAIDATNETQFVAGSALNSKSKLGVADWTGDGTPEVLYGNASDSKHIYYANVSGTPTEIVGEQANAVLGGVDFDGDGEKDVVYAGTSQTVYYYDVAADEDIKVEGVGQNSGGLGVGAPAHFYGGDEYWVPMMDGSSNPNVVNASGDPTELSADSMAKAPAAGVDWVGDSRLEVLHLNGNDKVAYTHFNGTTELVEDADGETLSAVHSAGVAGVVGDPSAELSVEAFEAAATGEGSVTVNVTTNQDLAALNVSLTGAENATLTLDSGDFTETGASPYTYSATCDARDGNYTATLVEAESSAGTVTEPYTANATVDAVEPTIESVTLTDETDENGVVTPEGSVTVSATVTGDVGTVTANLSAFDAGESVELERAPESSDTYEATVAVGPDVTDGDRTADVDASDGQGNTETATTGALVVDTDALSVELGPNRTVEADESVSFSPQSVRNETGGVDYDWAFGDSGGATGKHVEYTFDEPGTYEVVLTAADESDDTATATTNVTVESADSGDPTTTEPTTSEPTTEEPTTSQPPTSEPTTEDPTDPTTTEGPSNPSEPTDPTTAPTTANPTTANSTTANPATARGTTGPTTGTNTTSAPATQPTTTAPNTASGTGAETRADEERAAGRPTEPTGTTQGTSTVVDDPGRTPGESPGFGVVAAVVALAAAGLLARRE